jgi:hypothetical protein
MNEWDVRERVARLEEAKRYQEEEIKALKRDRWLLIGAVAFPVLNDLVERYIGTGPAPVPVVDAVIRVMGGMT